MNLFSYLVAKKTGGGAGGIIPKGLVLEDYDSDGYPHSARFVNLTSIPGDLLRNINTTGLFSRIDNYVIPDGVTSIGMRAFQAINKPVTMPNNPISLANEVFSNASFTEFAFKSDVVLGNSAFSACIRLTSIIFGGNVNAIPNNCFSYRSKALLAFIDFSHCQTIPPLYNTASLSMIASGCVIRIPAALSDTTLGEGNGWESESNWFDLTDIVWEVVNNAE